MKLKKDFGKQLKEIRKSKKLTQEQLAELVNVDTKHISFLETGRNFPSADLLEKLKNVFDIEYSDLFDFNIDIDKQNEIIRINNLLNKMTRKQISFIHKLVLEYSKL